jgi:hypothetical protein
MNGSTLATGKYRHPIDFIGMISEATCLRATRTVNSTVTGTYCAKSQVRLEKAVPRAACRAEADPGRTHLGYLVLHSEATPLGSEKA